MRRAAWTARWRYLLAGLAVGSVAAVVFYALPPGLRTALAMPRFSPALPAAGALLGGPLGALAFRRVMAGANPPETGWK